MVQIFNFISQFLQRNRTIVGQTNSLHNDEVCLFWENGWSFIQVCCSQAKVAVLKGNHILLNAKPKQVHTCWYFVLTLKLLLAFTGWTVGGDIHCGLHRWSILCHSFTSSWHDCLQVEQGWDSNIHGCCQKPWILGYDFHAPFFETILHTI